MNYKIFICYSAKYNKEIAGDLKRFFEEYKGIECFVAHDDIVQGSKWEDTIIDNLKLAQYFMPIQTEHLKTSYWCQQEAGYALARGIKIIPLIPNAEGTEPVGFYAKFQGFKIKTQDLRRSVKLWLIKEGIISDTNDDELEKRIIIFAASDSFEEAGRNTKYLLELESQFASADVLRILDITMKNDQILSSFSAFPYLRKIFVKYASIISKDNLEEFLKHQ